MTCTEERFLKDVSNHEMHILHEDGVYRHVRFKIPNSSSYHFDLITYPNYLVYSGDMGCYVFSRVKDMFEFFRADKRSNDGLCINTGYWAEKLRAVDGNRNNADAMEFDEDAFRKVINEYRVRWIREYGLNKHQRRALWVDVEESVMHRIEDGEHAACSAAYEFSHRAGDDTFQFDDFFDHSFKRFTFRFLWCCYAIAFGVNKYDETKARQPKTPEAINAIQQPST